MFPELEHQMQYIQEQIKPQNGEVGTVDEYKHYEKKISSPITRFDRVPPNVKDTLAKGT